MIETVPQLTIAAARAIAGAAFSEAERQSCAIVVVVLDAGSEILLVERGSGALVSSIEIARRKAECAVGFGMPTEILASVSASNPALANLPRMLPFEGGIPVIIDGRIAGAIGVSGASQEQDLACAKAGIAAVMSDSAGSASR
ncbi:hypothetical protein NS277_08230 [Novosphingobium barchaimii]|nr:hypothetical protein NS277_08230 [Novosphingobium barchaimii]